MRKPGHRTVVVLFTRDLRLHDQPALAAAAERARAHRPAVRPRRAILASFGAPNRVAFLLDSLRDLDADRCERGAERSSSGAATSSARPSDVAQAAGRRGRLRQRGRERLRAGARAAAAQRRSRARGVELEVYPGRDGGPARRPRPRGQRPLRVFTPYWRRWREQPRRDVLPPPARDRASRGVEPGRCQAAELDERQAGAGAAGRRRDRRPPPARRAGSTTGSRATASSPTISPPTRPRGSRRTSTSAASRRARSSRARSSARAREPFVRQLCWRDFNHQLLAAQPRSSPEDLRPRAGAGATTRRASRPGGRAAPGFPLVDAGMRQLLQEGFMHNRARLVTGSFLTKHLGIDWRRGAAHFFEHLVDGDVANNTANWQWVAGTGTDSAPEPEAEPAAPGGALRPRRHLRAAVRPRARHAGLPGPLRGGRVTGWETNERVLDSGGFESRQRVLVPEPVVEASEAGARTLGVTYWQAVDRFTRGGVRASWSGGGGRLKLLGGATLLTFGPPELSFDGGVVSCRHEIRGGLLALRAGGSVTLAQRPAGDEHELSVTVEEYLPRLAARAGALVDRRALHQGPEPVPRRRQPSLLRPARPERALVKVTVFGATGVVGRALLPLLAEHEVTAVSRSERDEPERALARRRRRDRRRRRRGARRRGRRLLPRPLPRLARLRAAGPSRGGDDRARGGERRRAADRLPRRSRRGRSRRVAAPAQPSRDRRAARVRRRAGDDAARRDDRRQGQRRVRDDPRPRRAATGDDHAELGLDADAADRARRRRALPRRRLRERGGVRRGLRRRRPRGDDLPADDRADRGPARPQAARSSRCRC